MGTMLQGTGTQLTAVRSYCMCMQANKRELQSQEDSAETICFYERKKFWISLLQYCPTGQTENKISHPMSLAHSSAE